MRQVLLLLIISTLFLLQAMISTGLRDRISMLSFSSLTRRRCSTSAAIPKYPTYISYDNFSFEVTKVSTTSSARLSTITTPHGKVECPNFVFCGTKAAMKAITVDQLRDEGSQIMLSNTYHLMIQPGADTVEKLGGLQKMTAWNGPMLTDSGGYQIFSMGHGSVSAEIKGSRGRGGGGNITDSGNNDSPGKGNKDKNGGSWQQTLLKISDVGATFRSYVDGAKLELTPERCMQIQKKLGADLIVVLDECTPFHVDKIYTEQSMHRSHEWGVRCLKEFQRLGCNGKQALYGIVQGGVYSDLRAISCKFVNENPFFGMAIGGCLGATREEMHRIVQETRRQLRNDRPAHLLGIGGVRDIFHGVRQGIDTFDCVHPTRLARHGGALVPASVWEEEAVVLSDSGREDTMIARRKEKEEFKRKQRQVSLARNRELAGLPPLSPAELELACRPITGSILKPTASKQVKHPTPARVVRDHLNIRNANMREDTRPVDSTCRCYTCRKYTRAYLHHLFEADESLGGTLMTIHNVHFMNRLMRRIREGIAANSLDEIEKEFIHPELP